VTAREPFVFGKGWVHSRDLIYFYGATRAMNDADEFESVVLRWSAGTWGLWQVATRLCSVVTATQAGSRIVLCTGIDGYVEVSESGNVRVEAIDDTDDGPDRLRHITFVRPVGHHIFALGMSRMVYARSLGGGWRRMDDGVRIPRQSPEIDGLKAIDGNENGELVVVGLRGGVWTRKDGPWRSVDSPTNLKLETVQWMSDTYYVGGGGGLLLKGESDSLKIVQHTAGSETFWSMAKYRGELFISTRRKSLWKLVGDDLEPVKLPGGANTTTGWLHANDDVLLSVGERDVLVYDGTQWTSLDPPPAEVAWPFEW